MARSERPTTTHTPGPWEVTPDPMFTRVRAVTSHRPIAECTTPGNTWPRDRMNARLIAAAPDLYEALQRIVDVNPDGCGCEHDDENCCARQADTWCAFCLASVAIAKAGR